MFLSIKIESQLSVLPLVRAMIRNICLHHALADEKDIEDIELSVHEALSNVICHAYNSEPNHSIDIIFESQTENISIHIKDNGAKSFTNISCKDTLEYNIFDIENIPEQGRGVFLILKMMDEVNFTTNGEENILILRKKFHQHA